MQRTAQWRCIVSNSVVYAITDTVIDTIVSVTVSAFLCPFCGESGGFRTLQRIFWMYFHDVVVLSGMGVAYRLHIVVSIR